MEYTPNIDRIAQQGVRFTNAFVTSSLCSPARAAILTALFGKWHLNSQPSGFNFYEVVKGTDKSIDWLAARASDDPFALFVHHKAPHSPHITPAKYDPFEGKGAFLMNNEAPHSKLENVGPANVINSRDDWEKIRKKKYQAPLESGTQAYKEWAFQTLYKGYFRQNVNLDENVGRLLNYLEETGLTKNTIIVYAMFLATGATVKKRNGRRGWGSVGGEFGQPIQVRISRRGDGIFFNANTKGNFNRWTSGFSEDLKGLEEFLTVNNKKRHPKRCLFAVAGSRIELPTSGL